MISLRPPLPSELAIATLLCLRSKAHWGYDATFMAACEPELTLSAEDLLQGGLIVASEGEAIIGVAQIQMEARVCSLEKLFIDPARMGEGLGRRMFKWAASAARSQGAVKMIVEADPGAVPFYRAMGCKEAGLTPSGSISGRMLPRLELALSN